MTINEARNATLARCFGLAVLILSVNDASNSVNVRRCCPLYIGSKKPFSVYPEELTHFHEKLDE